MHPSACTSTERMSSCDDVPMSTVSLPSPENVVSSVPSAFSRTSARSTLAPLLLPASTILPSPWIATAQAWSSLAPMATVDDAAGAEVGVEAAVDVVAHRDEVVVTAVRCITGDDGAAIGLHRHRAAPVVPAAHRRGDAAAARSEAR